MPKKVLVWYRTATACLNHMITKLFYLLPGTGRARGSLPSGLPRVMPDELFSVKYPVFSRTNEDMTHPDSHSHLHFRTGPKAPAGRRPRRLLRTARKAPGRTLEANPALDPAGGRGHLFAGERGAGERGADGRYQPSHSVRPSVCVWDMLMWA